MENSGLISFNVVFIKNRVKYFEETFLIFLK